MILHRILTFCAGVGPSPQPVRQLTRAIERPEGCAVSKTGSHLQSVHVDTPQVMDFKLLYQNRPFVIQLDHEGCTLRQSLH